MDYGPSIIIFLIILILIIAIIYDTKEIYCPPDSDKKDERNKCLSGNGQINYKGRPSKEDTTKDTLERLKFLANNQKYISKWTKAVIVGAISTLLLFFILYSRWPTVYELIVTFVIIFIVSLSLFGYVSHHLDAYTNFYMRENIEILSKNLMGNSTETKDNDENLKTAELSGIPKLFDL